MINNFLLGCDPEFVLVDTRGRVFNTGTIWEQGGEIGWDHGGRVQELRPEATKGAYALVKRLQTLIQSSKLASEELRCKAGARVGNESLGGHVHFGIPTAKITSTHVGALDRVTQLLEHLDILPSGQCADRRKGNYGRFGDIRDSNGHVEYRTMASWLYDPKVAYLCLTAAKLAAADPTGALEGLKNVTSFAGLEKWIGRYKHTDTNARRALDKVLVLRQKAVQIDPDVDFRGRWGKLGL